MSTEMFDLLVTIGDDEYPLADEVYAAEWMEVGTEKSVDHWMAIATRTKVQVRDGCILERGDPVCEHGCWNPLFILDLV